jgi:hypothetical protein
LELTGGLEAYDRAGEVRELHRFVRDSIRYVGDVYGMETVQTPQATLEVGAGDCDDKSALLASLLLSIGHPVRYVLARTKPQDPTSFSHVYVETPIRGRWVPLETIVPGKPMGWAPRQFWAAHRELGGPVYVDNVSSLGDVDIGFSLRPPRWIRKAKVGRALIKAAPFLAAGAALVVGGPGAAALAYKGLRRAGGFLTRGRGIIPDGSLTTGGGALAYDPGGASAMPGAEAFARSASAADVPTPKQGGNQMLLIGGAAVLLLVLAGSKKGKSRG